MQKVEGSSPFIRFTESPAQAGFFFGLNRAQRGDKGPCLAFDSVSAGSGATGGRYADEMTSAGPLNAASPVRPAAPRARAPSRTGLVKLADCSLLRIHSRILELNRDRAPSSSRSSIHRWLASSGSSPRTCLMKRSASSRRTKPINGGRGLLDGRFWPTGLQGRAEPIGVERRPRDWQEHELEAGDSQPLAPAHRETPRSLETGEMLTLFVFDEQESRREEGLQAGLNGLADDALLWIALRDPTEDEVAAVQEALELSDEQAQQTARAAEPRVARGRRRASARHVVRGKRRGR